MEKIDPIIRVSKSCEILGLGKTKIYQLISEGELKPIQLGARAKGFRYSDLQAWLNKQEGGSDEAS